MSGKQYYGGAIWTNHALDRLGERGLTQEIAWQAFRSPDRSFPAKEGGIEYQKRFGASQVCVIAKQNDKNEWVIISCWVNPPLPGTKDHKKQQDYFAYQKASFWGKFFLTIKKQLGL